MRLHLDDDSASPLLVRLLQKEGHDVAVPSDAGLAGKDDAVHLAHAVRDQRVCLTRNYTDFENLHDLVVAAQGHHPGILVVRQDNDRRRDLTPRGIVRAIQNLLASGTAIADQYIILNHRR